MVYDRFRGKAPSEPFYLDASEMDARPPDDAVTPEIAARNAMATIEEIVREDRARRKRAGLPALDPVEPGSEKGRKRRGRKGTLSGAGNSLLAWLRAWRPSPVHGFWTVMFLAVLIWPRAVLIGMLAVFVLCLVGVALFGQERLAALGGEVLARARRLRAQSRPRRDSDPFDACPDPFERLGKTGQDRLGP